MDTIMNMIGQVPIGMEHFEYMCRFIILYKVISEVLDIIKGLTFRVSKGI